MNAVRQSCRPKHQVLILKCYPKFQKHVADVKPNGSELSYLLYYASTRRSKVQKVGAFLEKKAASDVYRGKIGNVQVTLQILRALIDKSPRDLPLYSPYVLRILSLILGSKDINMVEETIPTWETFCEHHDVATLAADQAHIRRYEEVVKAYASLAGNAPMQTRGPLSAPMAIRWKSAGIQAIKCITSSDTVGADGGRQLSIIMPMILQNVYSPQEDYLATLQQRARANEKSEKESAIRRRMSVATVRTADTVPDTDPAAVSGTTADADRLAEEEVGVAALQSLNQIFAANNRGQIRIATTAMLKFIIGKAVANRPGTDKSTRTDITRTWATTLMETVARWTPVQDRFIILVTIMETLVRSPVTEENLEQQLLLVTLIDHLLRSTINMIGLSVMDVLLGLIQHILLLLQLWGKGSNVLPHHQQTDAIDLFKESEQIIDPSSSTRDNGHDPTMAATSPSAPRQELLALLQRCIGNLATHIYYSDQISDMITAILLRLKPSSTSGVSSPVAAIEHPAATAQAISNSVNLQEDPNTDEFFSFGTARVTALNAIRSVLIVANTKQSASGAGAVGRNRVSVQTWEGTQWLLRDEDRRVRRAYVDALLIWLRLEMSKHDLRVMEDKRHTARGTSRANGDSDRTASLTRRVVSSASQRTSKPAKSTFLQLLHLAIYNNTLESPESDSDILLLHLLLVNLIEKLGVNAVKSGLPMIARLQEDINLDHLFATPPAKINVGSLVHGYLLAICVKFDLDATLVGYGIQSEIQRRRNLGLWLDGVRIPPLPLDQIMSASFDPLTEKRPLEVLAKESLKPFDAFPALIDQIANAYSSMGASPPTSPPSSPGRVFSMPILTSSGISSSTDHELPSSFKEAMLAPWTKDSCIAAVERENAPTASVHGSRAGTNHSGRNGLFISTDHSPRDASPVGATSPALFPTSKPRAQTGDSRQGRTMPSTLLPIQQEALRRSSPRGTGPPTPLSSSDQQPTLRVDDLKRVLAGGALADAFSHRTQGSAIRSASPLRTSSTAYQDFAETQPRQVAEEDDSDDSDSIVSAEGFESASEGDPTHPLPPPQMSPLIIHDHSNPQVTRPFEHTITPPRGNTRPSSKDYAKTRPRSSSSASEDPEANARALKGEIVAPIARGDGTDDEEVPPVPPLPSSLSLHNNMDLINKMNSAARVSNGSVGRPTTAPERVKSVRTKPASVSEASMDRNSLRTSSQNEKKVLMQQLVSGIEVGDVSTVGRGVGRPPY
ncbi:plasma membrane localization protein [Trapelia coarctata]|nr:plasma membrane localization protein [Trapelia coarctata]